MLQRKVEKNLNFSFPSLKMYVFKIQNVHRTYKQDLYSKTMRQQTKTEIRKYLETFIV